MKIIFVKEIANGQRSVGSEVGRKVYEEIKKYLDKKQEVVLDFSGIKLCPPPFFNASIGQLFSSNQSEDVYKVVNNVRNLHDVGRQSMKLVAENCDQYYNDPQYRKAFERVMSEVFNGDFFDR
jgi:hypothetical protein